MEQPPLRAPGAALHIGAGQLERPNHLFRVDHESPNRSSSAPGNGRGMPFSNLDCEAYNRIYHEFPPWTEPTMNRVGCAAWETDEEGEPTGRPCSRPPEFICSRCRLVKYCDVDHQKAHYATHKKDCLNWLASPRWVPRWWQEKRAPPFLDPHYSDPYYSDHRWIWSREPAVDILNLGEREAKSHDHLAICFASADDINDLLKTINGIPDSYQGQIDVLFNTTDPYCFSRFMILFSILYCPDLTYEQAAEFCAHYLYSLRLTPTMHERVQPLAAEAVASMAPGLYNSLKLEDGPLASIISGYGRRKRGTEPLRFCATMQVLGGAIEHLHQAAGSLGMTLSEAEAKMQKITLGRRTQDILDHDWAYLQPHHRVSLNQFRESGMLRPFGVNVDNFTMPNRMMFTTEGLFLPPHHANPVQGQDMDALLECGSAYEVPENDLIGALYFHIKEELVKFMRRIDEGRITLTVSGIGDLGTLAVAVRTKKLERFKSGTFDRIYFGNQMDDARLGPDVLLRYWTSQHLNSKNPNAIMFALFRDWLRSFRRLQTPASIPQQDAALKKAARRADMFLMPKMTTPEEIRDDPKNPDNVHLSDHTGLFLDFKPAMERYMASLGVDKLAARSGLKRKAVNTIVPVRYGCTLEKPTATPDIDREQFYRLGEVQRVQWGNRFVEFGAKR